ncbi:hypothetical protein P153DRAFT_191561 [Dothidotthia symphoricarpi CBS 119687]|uniref:Uncharacterized protein n=1 Tax=Dothidotthia symphoricarpi CBS 119687 TaxID=1392245 RepID=A0A6A6ALE2_9PLEO|nr:uncharacterized protein P153DRAFT_191561 [Dothidotthia symphoricarpi CBS 119687]KAF2131271.1 hypothetical protein P153DRAFT_191561 [Dothidotthia symphoricarpi CBS 119687]
MSLLIALNPLSSSSHGHERGGGRGVTKLQPFQQGHWNIKIDETCKRGPARYYSLLKRVLAMLSRLESVNRFGLSRDRNAGLHDLELTTAF